MCTGKAFELSPFLLPAKSPRPGRWTRIHPISFAVIRELELWLNRQC